MYVWFLSNLFQSRGIPPHLPDVSESDALNQPQLLMGPALAAAVNTSVYLRQLHVRRPLGSLRCCTPLCFSLETDLKKRIVAADRMISCLSGKLSFTLWRLRGKKKRDGISLASIIEEVTQLSNADLYAAERKQLVDQLLDMANHPGLIQECWLLLLKNTRHNNDANLCLRVWKLFWEVAQKLQCPKELTELVVGYTKEVAAIAAEIPTARQLAWNISGRLQVHENITRNVPRLCPGVHSTKVYLADGSHVEVYYDRMSYMGDLIGIVAYEIGLETQRFFQVYRVIGDKDEMLDRKGSVSFALHIRPDKLMIKREMMRLGEDKSYFHPVFLRHSYAHFKSAYLKGTCVVSESDAVRLGALLVAADHDDLDALYRKDRVEWVVRKALPKGDLKDGYERFIDRIKETVSEIGKISIEEAMKEFLCGVDKLLYGNCLIFSPGHIKCSKWNFSKDIRLGINRHGLHFFKNIIGDENTLTFGLDSLVGCRCINNELDLKICQNGSIIKVQMWSEDGPCICRATTAHMRDYKKSRASNTGDGESGVVSGRRTSMENSNKDDDMLSLKVNVGSITT